MRSIVLLSALNRVALGMEQCKSSFPDWHDLNVTASVSYVAKEAGCGPGSYERVKSLASCEKETVTYDYSIGTMAEEVALIFRSPIDISNVAVYMGSGNHWHLASYYDASRPDKTRDIAFLNNANISYTGESTSPLVYASASGRGISSRPQHFLGRLMDDDGEGRCPTDHTYAGPEIILMRNQKCDGKCAGFSGKYGSHGWAGHQKLFAVRAQFLQGICENRPAFWILPSQVVNAQQYGCNCRGMGGLAGCGELDVAEIIETDKEKMHFHSQYYQKDDPSGYPVYTKRVLNEYVTILVIIDGQSQMIKILHLAGNSSGFGRESIPYESILKLESYPETFR